MNNNTNSIELINAEHESGNFQVADHHKRIIHAVVGPDKTVTLKLNAGVFRLYGLKKNQSTSEIANGIGNNMAESVHGILQVAAQRAGESEEKIAEWVDDLPMEEIMYLAQFIMAAMVGKPIGDIQKVMEESLMEAPQDQESKPDQKQAEIGGAPLFKGQ
jgi:hypothetical protein